MTATRPSAARAGEFFWNEGARARSRAVGGVFSAPPSAVAHPLSSSSSSLKNQNHSFLAGSSDSDSDEDRRVVLKSARDKRLAELHDTVDEIRVSGERARDCAGARAHARACDRRNKTTRGGGDTN
jgi:hypothetical protein